MQLKKHMIHLIFALGADLSNSCNMTLPVSQEHINYVVSLYTCFNNNTLGKLWTSSMPYLFPFIVEYRYGICITNEYESLYFLIEEQITRIFKIIQLLITT